MAGPDADTTTPLKTTVLADRHRALGARMVPFAGYEMPVQYPAGIIAEHGWTRTAAGLFDVSHMGQCFLKAASHEAVARALEALVPADILNLPRGAQRYTQFLNVGGGILDDLMVARSPDPADDGMLFLVVNAACKDADFALLEANLPHGCSLILAPERSLLAIQGPESAAVMADHCPESMGMTFMSSRSGRFDGVDLTLSRSGYTGEDGFELSIPSSQTGEVWDTLLADPRVKPIGLGARDSLRLEAGLCLYGHDLDGTTSPVEGAIGWSIQKRRRLEGGFPGAARIQREFAEGPSRLRVGIVPEGRAPVREGAAIKAADGTPVGVVTSGGFGPTVNGPVAMGYVPRALATPGTPLLLDLRGRDVPASVATLPFTPHRFHR
ncbi:MAG: glycine cleavage system aminomethyltransferase GcvT [Labrys sp. (in: a-proteobacteria)]